MRSYQDQPENKAEPSKAAPSKAEQLESDNKKLLNAVDTLKKKNKALKERILDYKLKEISNEISFFKRVLCMDFTIPPMIVESESDDEMDIQHNVTRAPSPNPQSK